MNPIKVAKGDYAVFGPLRLAVLIEFNCADCHGGKEGFDLMTNLVVILLRDGIPRVVRLEAPNLLQIGVVPYL